jgi:hypothetical protein
MESNDNFRTNYERLARLGAQIAEMYQTGSDVVGLGNVALELITIRSQFEQYETEMDAKARESVNKTIRELEKSIVSLYMLNMIGEKRRRNKEFQFFNDYVMYQR